MKKWKQLAIIGLAAVSMTSCKTGGQKEPVSEAVSAAETTEAAEKEDSTSAPEDETGAVEMPNPFEEAEGPEELKKAGVSMEAPENAEDAGYWIISGEVAEISFKLDDHAYSYRGAVNAEDFAGIFEEFEPDATAVSDCGADEDLVIKTTVSGGRLASWAKRGAKYTLYTPDSVEDQELIELCIQLIGKN